MEESSYYLNLSDRQLHIFRIKGNSSGPVVFCVHGAIENGLIFYSKTKKGLAYYLASRGYDVFVVDLGGRGKSTPKVASQKTYSQYDNVVCELPQCLELIKKLRGDAPMHWVGHSWGGVLLAALYARQNFIKNNLVSCVFFGAKRQIKVINIHKIFIINIIWKFFGNLLIKLYGYLPAKKFKLGSDDEPKDFFQQCNKWVNSDRWIDEDGYDYNKFYSKSTLVPTLFLTGINDHCLGHRHDVSRFMSECGGGAHNLRVLSRDQGAKANYNHIDILTHPLARDDHFPQVVSWMQEHEQRQK
ncbi:MAG: alpha/beta fold hydrolase [Francisellaceae bacterium]|jgi:predicted alpha/beta hydrolase|nr:alpha/beta fold hydrolase [Francisellaceae bacterium]MBT6207644.1 alpha/beta fold hydrolase [Francisellaceae bacterium]MBT6538433.1 alpha/beta fold hydrolase [Francisellaceae bacterium]